jgi:mRNA-degrading endonuclease toxin of MazEF toxin-antitoxin module
MPRAVWKPSAGGPVVAEQRPARPATVLSDGSVPEQRSVASEGPCPTEVGGGAGGAPDGRSMPIYRVSWD